MNLNSGTETTDFTDDTDYRSKSQSFGHDLFVPEEFLQTLWLQSSAKSV
jgi:hypothetical protein